MNKQPKIGVLTDGSLGIPSLHALLQNKLVASIGLPDRRHDAINDIKQLTAAYHFDPVILSKPTLEQSLTRWIEDNQLDVVFVFTFPWRIPADVLNKVRVGFFNFHFGLLPQYRGANAIFPAIKNREPYGGITVHMMDADLDTGDILHIEKEAILPTDTYGMYSARLANLNIAVLQKILPGIFSGNINTVKQEEQNAAYYSKPVIDDISIKWELQTAEEIIALVNACNPWNKGAYTSLHDMPLRITEACISDEISETATIGEIIKIDTNGMHVQCIGHKNITLKIITIEEGIYSAQTFTHVCGIKSNARFKDLATLQQTSNK
ncbi:MAG: hypothetical protein KDC07_00815 [Chitinophagaceae bacterium]|nr:hypothetical protein [Chitinophagaceae bacterium]MCB9044621.1 hypothetical protein [Chitinophagales bacterium]